MEGLLSGGPSLLYAPSLFAGDAMTDPFRKTELPFNIPDFANIRTEHYRPAFARAMAEHRAEIDAIASDASALTFDNTIAALERSGARLRRVPAVFWNLVGTDAGDGL